MRRPTNTRAFEEFKEYILAAIDDLKNVVQSNTDTTARVVAELQRLAAHAAGGGTVTDADLNTLANALATNTANLAAAVDTTTTQVPA